MKEEIQDKRAAALKATLDLISQQGFHATPMSQIAKYADVSIGTIYHYFTGKDDLINALYMDINMRCSRYILTNYNNNAPVQECFTLLIKNIVHYFTENPKELSFLEQYENSPLITAATYEEVEHFADPLRALFERAIGLNVLKSFSQEKLVALLFGAVISLIKIYISGQCTIDDEVLSKEIDAICEMIER